MKRGFAFTAPTLVISTLTAHAAGNMKAFPAPDKGTVRYILQLPKQEEES